MTIHSWIAKLDKSQWPPLIRGTPSIRSCLSTVVYSSSLFSPKRQYKTHWPFHFSGVAPCSRKNEYTRWSKSEFKPVGKSPEYPSMEYSLYKRVLFSHSDTIESGSTTIIVYHSPPCPSVFPANWSKHLLDPGDVRHLLHPNPLYIFFFPRCHVVRRPIHGFFYLEGRTETRAR